MFKRRKPLNVLQNIRELFWPSMGWIRAATYTKHRVIRLADSEQRIALGLAIGTAVSFTPLIGTHFIQAGLFSYLTRANIMAGLIGTFFGNPWTFPFMWYAAIEFGSLLFNLMGLPADVTLPAQLDFALLWDMFTHDPLRLFMPWVLGGYLLGLLTIPVTYFIFYHLICWAKAAREKAKSLRKKPAKTKRKKAA